MTYLLPVPAGNTVQPLELEALIQTYPEQIDLTGPSWYWQAGIFHQLNLCNPVLNNSFKACLILSTPDPLHTITQEAQQGPQVLPPPPV